MTLPGLPTDSLLQIFKGRILDGRTVCKCLREYLDKAGGKTHPFRLHVNCNVDFYPHLTARFVNAEFGVPNAASRDAMVALGGRAHVVTTSSDVHAMTVTLKGSARHGKRDAPYLASFLTTLADEPLLPSQAVMWRIAHSAFEYSHCIPEFKADRTVVADTLGRLFIRFANHPTGDSCRSYAVAVLGLWHDIVQNLGVSMDAIEAMHRKIQTTWSKELSSSTSHVARFYYSTLLFFHNFNYVTEYAAVPELPEDFFVPVMDCMRQELCSMIPSMVAFSTMRRLKYMLQYQQYGERGIGKRILDAGFVRTMTDCMQYSKACHENRNVAMGAFLTLQNVKIFNSEMMPQIVQSVLELDILSKVVGHWTRRQWPSGLNDNHLLELLRWLLPLAPQDKSDAVVAAVKRHVYRNAESAVRCELQTFEGVIKEIQYYAGRGLHCMRSVRAAGWFEPLPGPVYAAFAYPSRRNKTGRARNAYDYYLDQHRRLYEYHMNLVEYIH